MEIAINQPIQDPPGPQGLPFVGHLFDVAHSKRMYTFKRWREAYGDVIQATAVGRQLYFINHPDHIKHVLQTNNRNYQKGLGYKKLTEVMGNGLFTSEGEFWRRQRRLAQPAFHRQKINTFGEVMTQTTQQMLDRWEREYATPNRPFDVSLEMMRLTLDIVTKALFSTALKEEEITAVSEAFPPLLHETNTRARVPFDLRERFAIQANREYKQNLGIMNDIIYRIIRERRQSNTEHSDLLGMLMAAQDEETGIGMTDEQLRDEVMTIFIAGHETTATALSWTWSELSKNVAVRERFFAEVDEVLQGKTATVDNFPQLSYTLMVFKEAMRLYPPLPMFSRTPLTDDVLDNYRITANSEVMIMPYLLHRDPRFWENPEGFDPLRFTPEKELAQNKFAYLPFGGGPRLCMGNNFALFEAVLIMATISQKYQLNLLPMGRPHPKIVLTTRTKNGVWVRLRKR